MKFMNFIGRLNRILNVFGISAWRMNPRPSLAFAKNYFKNKKVTVIEIGTAEGEHALQIPKNLNVEKIYLIDPWTSYKEYETGENFNKTFEICKKRLKKYKDKIIYVRDFSDNVVKKVPNADYIYIDGNHNYKFVKKDIENYYPKVKDNGILGGNDINLFDVSKALVEYCGKNKLVPQIKHLDWWIVKK